MKHQNRLILAFLTIISLFITSCATILSPEKGPYTLNSNPSGAQVYDENDNQLGTTPFDMKKVNKKVKTLTLKKDGYIQKDVAIYRKTKNDLLFLDAMLLCIPCIIDLSSENTTTIEPKNTTVELKLAPKEHEVPIMVAIDKVSYEHSDKISGKINGTKKTPDDRGVTRTLGDVDYLESTIMEKLQKSYIDPVSVATNNSNRSANGKAKIRMKAVINDLDFTLKGKQLKLYEGTENMKCTWNFYRASDEKVKLGSITTNVNLTRGKGSNATILEEVMTEAVADLLAVDTLYDFLSKSEKVYMSETKGSEIKLISPAKQNFESSKEMLKTCKEGVVTVMTKDGFGSGFIISSDGYIVTNYHVAEGQKNNIQVKMNSNIKLKATVVKSNEEYDLLLLKWGLVQVELFILHYQVYFLIQVVLLILVFLVYI